MIKNKHRYTFLRMSRLLFAPIYSLMSLFIKKNNNIIITSSLNMEFSDNSKALFEILIKDEKYKDKVYFVINDGIKRRELNAIYPEKFITNTKFSDALFILKAKYWFCSAMELPLATFFQRYVRQSIHLGHGMLYKKIGLQEKKVKWYKKLYYKLITSSFSYTLSTSEFFKNDISLGFGVPLNRVLISPQPKTFQIECLGEISDDLFVDTKNKHILYAPTWRPYEDVKIFPFQDLDLKMLQEFLIENNCHIWLRVHPRFEQNISADILSITNLHLFSAKKYVEINNYLSYFDVLITDYSSIYFDFLTLEKPVLFFDYDFEKYNSYIGVIDKYEQIKAIETTKSQMHFISQLESIFNYKYDLTKISLINQMVNFDIKNGDIANYISTTLLDRIQEKL